MKEHNDRISIIIDINGVKYKEVPAKTNDKICKCCDYFLDNGKCTLEDCPCCKDYNILERVKEQTERIWIHKKYNREYRIVSDNARLKNSNGEWIDCVIYAPLYENEFEMFAREKDSFYKEFEKK